jgi:hypothetical protein
VPALARAKTSADRPPQLPDLQGGQTPQSIRPKTDVFRSSPSNGSASRATFFLGSRLQGQLALAIGGLPSSLSWNLASQAEFRRTTRPSVNTRRCWKSFNVRCHQRKFPPSGRQYGSCRSSAAARALMEAIRPPTAPLELDCREEQKPETVLGLTL